MNHRHVVSSALASVLALGLGNALAAQDMAKVPAKERCYGVALAGQNDCANLSGSHSCAGYSKVDKDPGEWKDVAKGTCKEMGGLTEAEAKARANMPANTPAKKG